MNKVSTNVDPPTTVNTNSLVHSQLQAISSSFGIPLEVLLNSINPATENSANVETPPVPAAQPSQSLQMLGDLDAIAEL